MKTMKNFRLADITKLHYGNKFDRNKMTYRNPDVNFVSRTATNNGISDVVDRIDGVEPYPAGCVSLAFGGSIGSCFLQEKPFYTGQNVGVIEFPSSVSDEAKLYFVTVLEKVCKAKFVTFSDEINKHFKTDLSVTLPAVTVVMPDWAMLETLLKVHGGGVGMSKIDTSSWKKFKISELFDVKKGKRLTQADMIPGNIKFVGATSTNNGETARIGNTEHIHSANTITVTYNGSVGEVFYQDEPFWASDDVNVLYPKFEMTVQVALFLISVIKKLRDKYSYNQKWVKEALENDEILLPVTTVEQPDWDYMQERIAELEQERIAELEQYLVATGLNDYTLTDEDLKTLFLSGSRRDEAGNLLVVAGLRKEMKEFRIPAVFDIKNGHNVLKTDVQLGSGKRPYVTAGESNNSVMGYVDYDESMLETGNCIFIGGKTMVVSYQEDPFFSNDSHNLLLYCKDAAGCGKLVSLYMISQLEKALWRYSWNDSISFKKIQKESFMLPIQTDATGRPAIDPAKMYHPDGFVPDWDYMAAYIRAIEKLVIKDVVDFKDAFISKAKEAVGA